MDRLEPLVLVVLREHLDHQGPLVLMVQVDRQVVQEAVALAEVVEVVGLADLQEQADLQGQVELVDRVGQVAQVDQDLQLLLLYL